MILDLSHLYRTETIVIAPAYKDENGKTIVGETLFEVTVQEVSQESYAKLQDSLMKNINLDMPMGKKGRNSAEAIQQQIMSQALQSGKFSPSRYSAEQSVLAIQSWTLKDKSGQDVPVSLEAWNALPKWATDEIEKGIERLNPTLDEEFQD